MGSSVVLENIYKSFSSQGVVTAELTEEAEVDSTTRSPGSPVLRRINVTVQDGEFMVLVGPSGCGKSTLLRVIAGLEELTAGNIWVGDRLVNDLPPKARDIAMVFQSYALYPHLTVYDNIAFGLRRAPEPRSPEATPALKSGIQERAADLLAALTRKLPKRWRYSSARETAVDERVRTVAQLLQIETLLHRLPKQLSGGQKQRVALGRAMARNPQVFLMDEPLSNLDAKLRAETRSQIVKLQRQLGITTIYVTHDQVEAMTMGDRIAVMNGGRIQQVAPPLELYNRPANRFVAEFIGSPPMNFLTVEFKAPLLVTHPQFRLTLPESWAKALQSYDGRSLLLGIRPEHLSIGAPAPKNLRVQVERVEALGNETDLTVSLGGESSALQVRVAPDLPVKLGEELWLSIAPDKVHCFDLETGIALFVD